MGIYYLLFIIWWNPAWVDPTAPAPPTNVSTQAINTSRIDLSWTDNSGSNEDGFKIQCSIGGGGWNDVNTVASDVNSYSHTNLTSDMVYTYQVCAYHNTYGDSEWVSSSSDSPFPFEPNGLVVTAADSSAILGWNESTESDWGSYKIYRSTLPGGSYNLIDADHDSNSYTDNGLSNGIFYYYVVTTVDTSNHESAYSNEDSVFPKDSNAPAKPLGLEATGGDAFVSLVWDDNNEPDLAGYNVYRSMVSGGAYVQIAGGIEPNSYTDNGLGKGKTYYYVIKAVDTSLNLSIASDEASAIPSDDEDPDAPRNLMASGGEGSVTLYWTASVAPDVNGYNIYRSQSQGFDPNVSNQVASIVKGVSFEDSPVADDVALYYKASAEDTSGNKSLPSNEVMAIAHTPAPPNAPSGLSAASISSIQININWTDNSENESGFRIERKNAGGSYQSIADTTAGIEDYNDTSCSAATTYTYRVLAINSDGNSAPSDEAGATTAPAAPSVFAALAVDVNTIQLSWKDNSTTEDGFRIERSADDENYAFLCNKEANSIGHEDSGLDSDGVYSYCICAFDINEVNSVWSYVSANSPVPCSPSNFIASDVNGVIELQWDLSSDTDVNDYRIYRDITSDFTPGAINRIDTVTDVNEYTDDTADCNVTYYYRVSALDTFSNESEPSEVNSAFIGSRVHNITQDKWYYFIQDAIDQALSQDTIKVSQSTFYENIVFGDLDITLTSTNPDDPCVVAATVIHGGGSGTCLRFLASDCDIEVTGFTITGGYARVGAGIRCVGASPKIVKCKIKDNNAIYWGAGIFIVDSSGTVVLIECEFENNSSSRYGGAIFVNSVDIVEINSCSFINNTAYDYGGALYGSGTTITFTNCLLSGNSAPQGGGAIYLGGGTSTITNSTFYNNETTGNGGGLFNDNSNPSISNCIFSENTAGVSGDQIYGGSPTVDYSYVEGGWTGAGDNNLDVNDPGLDNDGYHLEANSPCINAGDPNYIAEEDEKDIDGNPRVMAERVDMGADEYINVIYVDADANGSDNGTSWSNAYNYLQDALSDANAGDEIWVANGIYYPDLGTGCSVDDPNETFELVENTLIYGGFAGYGASDPNERDIGSYQSILSGDIDGDDVNDGLALGGNSFHVVTGADETLLDGFTITGGDTTGAADPNGAGVYCDGTSPTISNCVIVLNKSTANGAGMYNANGAEPLLINCLFCGNWSMQDGAGIYNNADSNAVLVNCTISANKALGDGGGVYCKNSDPVLDNCILWGNIDDVNDTNEAAQIYSDGGNPAINYSCIQGWTSGGSGNTASDPNFVAEGYWDWRQSDGSDFTLNETFAVDPCKVIIYDFRHNHSDFGKSPRQSRNYFIRNVLCSDLSSDPCCEEGDAGYKIPIWDNSSGDTDTVTAKKKFDEWFRSDANAAVKWDGPINTNLEVEWKVVNDGKGILKFDSDHFWPIDGLGWTIDPCEVCDQNENHEHNHDWTLQYHTTCTYIPGQIFSFEASDDLFVAINNKIVVDKGGYWETSPSKTELKFEDGDVLVYDWDDQDGNRVGTPYETTISFGMSEGDIYDFDLFFAQRCEPCSVLVMEKSAESYPFFVKGDYGLDFGSACIDSGDGNSVPVGVSADLGGGLRLFDDANVSNTGAGVPDYVDMGAYERQYQLNASAYDDSYSMYNTQVLTVDAASGVLVNDSDDNFDSLTVDLVSDVASGELSLNSDGSFVYVPEAGFVGDVNFVYRAYDEQLYSNDANVIISVYGPIDAKAGMYDPVRLPQDNVDLVRAEVTGGNANGTVSLEWSVTEKPFAGDVDFDPDTQQLDSTSSELNPTVKLSVDPNIFELRSQVEFVLKLRAEDGMGSWDEAFVSITLLPENLFLNRAPHVDAGDYDTILLPHQNTIQLKGTVTDDGLLLKEPDRHWYVDRVPYGGIVTIDNPESENATATFNRKGEYWLRLWASDGIETSEDIAVITVAGTDNNAPVVYAGPDTTISSPNELYLILNDANVTDDGRTSPCEYKWSVIGLTGGRADFNDPCTLHPMVTFDKPDIYELTLTAYDGQFRVSDEVIIEVNEPVYGQEFDIGAGSDHEITLPAYAYLAGVIYPNDVCEPNVDLKWSQLTGSGSVTFINDTSLVTAASFSRPGTYKLQLKGIYGGITDVNQVTITVNPGTRISGGQDHTLIADDTINKYAWACGSNDSGQLGLDSFKGSKNIPVRVHGHNGVGELGNIDAVAAGAEHSLALDEDRTVWSWGDDSKGELGNGEGENPSSTPIHVLGGNGEPLLENILTISAGRSGKHSLAVDVSGHVWAWGYDGYGQLGKGGGGITSDVPMEVLSADLDLDGESDDPNGFLSNIVAVSAASNFSVALEKLLPDDNDCNGRVYTFGYGSGGCLGDGRDLTDYNDHDVPLLVVGPDRDGDSNSDEEYMQNIVAVAAGCYHTLALEKLDPCDSNYNGRVYAWGSEAYARLGDGVPGGRDISIPVMVRSGMQDGNSSSDTALENIIAVSAGETHSMALDKDGNVWTWGYNSSGQLGDGSLPVKSLTPVKVVAPDRDQDGIPDDLNNDANYSNDYLGDDIDIPIVAISAAYYHCLAMDKNGNIYSWGYNYFGQLGIGKTQDKDIPQLIALLGARVKNLDQAVDKQWYFTIQDAIDKANEGDALVAYPGEYYESIVFGVVNVTLTSSDPYDRDIVSKTIIDGENKTYAVKFKEGSQSTITGFTIRNATDYGICCFGGDDNTAPEITNNIIYNNGDCGIYLSNCEDAVIKNNLIYGNGDGESSDAGIYFYSPDDVTLVRNNTIVSNNGNGIYDDDDTEPQIRNCIVWNNGTVDANNLVGVTDVNYCAVGGGFDGADNFSVDANIFESTDPNLGFHLRSTSSYSNPCINGGDPNGDYSSESDIDGDPRVMGGRVDIGADEFMPYLVDAGDNYTVTVNQSLRFSDASVTYSGLPEAPSDNLTLLWSVVSGPNGWSDPLGDSNSVLKATAIFDKVGRYLLKLDVFEDANHVGRDGVEVVSQFDIDINSIPDEVIIPDISAKLSADITGDCPDANSIHWTAPVYPKVFFDTPTLADTNAVFTEPGIYEIELSITDDLTGTILGQEDIWVPVNYQHIIVDINAPDQITLPKNRIHLKASVSGAVPDNVCWITKEQDEELVVFDSNTSLQTWVEFESYGFFEIGLIAYDSSNNVIGVDTVVITVNPSDEVYLEVDAGEFQQIPWPQNFAFLSGIVDGNEGAVISRWVYSGPNDMVTILDPCSADTQMRFNDIDSDGMPEAGLYEFTLVIIDACDSNNILAADNVMVWLSAAMTIIYAGGDQSLLYSPNGVDVKMAGEILLGTCDSVQWVDESNSVTFENANKLDPNAHFTSPGTYELGLVAKDDAGTILALDTVIVNIGYQQVIIDAGVDQELTDFPLLDEVGLHGRVIEGEVDSVEWIFPPGVDANGDSDSLDTWVSFSEPNVYQIGLIAKVNDVNVGWDIVNVKVYPPQQTVTIDINSPWDVTLPNAQLGLTAMVSGTYSSVGWVFNDPNNLLDITDNGGSNPHYATVDFYEPGTYEIGFVVKYYETVVGFETAVITVHPEFKQELIVTADSEPYVLILPDPCQVSLSGSISGQGVHDFNEWVDPTGLVTFDPDPPFDTNSLTAEFDEPGFYDLAYVVRNGGSDGEVVAFDIVSVFVYPSGYEEVIVDAGVDQEFTLPLGGSVDVNLYGTVTGFEDCNTRWLDPSGGLIDFADVNELESIATFAYPGVYEIDLVALSDGNVVAADTMVITVNAFDNELVYVNAGEPNSITFLVEEHVNLSGSVEGSIYDRIQWVFDYNEMPESVSFGDPNSLLTTASFAQPGIYTLNLCAFMEDVLVGWDTVEITVNLPEVFVDAKVDLGGGQEVDEYTVLLLDSVVDVNLMALIYGANPDTLDFEWVCEDGNTAAITWWDSNNTVIDPNVEINQAGYYLFSLNVKQQGQSEIIGKGSVPVVVVEDDPVADAGTGYPTVALNQQLWLNDADAWLYPGRSWSSIQWSSEPSSGVDFDPASGDINPTVTFQSEGIYVFTLTVEDDAGASDSDKVTINVETPSAFVYAGEPKTTLPYYSIPLDDVVVSPLIPGLSYEWIVTSGAEEAVSFGPSRFVKNPNVTFNTEGVFVLTLIVNDRVTPYDQISTVSITVETNPLQDKTDPNIEIAAQTDSGPIDPNDQNVNGKITITVDANDDNLAYIEVKMIQGSSEIVIPADSYEILGGTWDNPTELQQTHTIDAYFSGDVILQATAYDRFGNDANVSIPFNSNHTIRSFSVEPDSIDQPGQKIGFSAVLNSVTDVSWTINLYEYDDVGVTPICDPCGGLSIIIDVNDAYFTEDGWANGAYIAQLDANGHSAQLPIDVLIDLSQDDLVADINDSLEIQYDAVGVPLDSRETITEGLYDLWGKAYYPDFPNDVYFKVELYDSEVLDSGELDSYNFSGTYLIKNLTPGYLDSDGFANATVGTGTQNGLFGTLDFSGINNGPYYLVLTVKCHGLYQYDDVSINLDCPLKIGNVKFSQQDLTIPIGGYPLTVIRSYDSLNRNKDGDFGFGWTYSFANMEIELDESRQLWMDENYDLYTFRLGSDYERNVTLTLPDGRRVTFLSYLYGSQEYGVGDWTLKYHSPDGVDAVLETDPADSMTLTSQNSFYGWGTWWNDHEPLDRSYPYYLQLNDVIGFVLTMGDGTKYRIKRHDYGTKDYPEGSTYESYHQYECRGKPYLDSIELANGDEVVFDVNTEDPEDPVIDGVAYYQNDEETSAKNIVFERDSDNRIVAVYPPSELDGNDVKTGGVPFVQYEYDSYGNLEKVHKLVDRDAEPNDQNETLTYVYQDATCRPAEHYLTDILDPRGLSPIRYVYDDGGRLIAIYDAAGNYIEIKHDLYNRTETVIDRLGNPTIYGYDYRGRVTSVTKILNGKSIATLYDFDDPLYPDSPSAVTDPCGNTISYKYDSAGRPTLIIDPANNASQNYYDDHGNLTRSSQWAPKDPDAQNPSFPADYNEISRSTNKYYYRSGSGELTNLLVQTDVFVALDDPDTNDVNETQIERTSYSYDDSNNLLLEVRKIDPCGLLEDIVTSYLYDEAASGSVDQPYSISAPYYALAGNPVYTRYFGYDENGRQVKSWYFWLDPNDPDHEVQVTSNNVYDDGGRVVEVNRVETDYYDGEPCAPADAITLSQTFYNSIGKVDMTVDEANSATVYEYDERGNLVETARYDCNDTLLSVSQTLYDVEGRVVVSVGPFDPYDANYKPIGSENVYDDLGRVVKTRRWADVEIITEYITNDDDEIIGLAALAWLSDGNTPTDGNELSYSRSVYDDLGRVAASVVLDEYGLEQVTTYEYDSAGRQVAVVDPCGYRTQTHYENGRRAWVVDARGCQAGADPNDYKTRFVYDAAGRVVTTIHPPTQFADSNGAEHTYSHVGFDALGRKLWQSSQTAIADPNTAADSNQTRWFEQDAAGRLTAVILPPVVDPCEEPNYEGWLVYPRSEYEYDDFGNLVIVRDNVKQYSDASIVDAGARETIFEFSKNLSQKSRTLPNGLTEYKEYDQFGRLILATDFKGQDTEYEYNYRGLLAKKKYYYSGAGEPNETVQYAYDNLGRRMSVTKGSDVTTYSYNDTGNVVEVNSPEGVIHYDYNSITNRKEATYTDDTRTEYDYDVMGRLAVTRLVMRDGNTVDPAEETVHDYNATGSRDWTGLANGTDTEYSYNALNRLTNVTHISSLSETLSSYTYTLAADGMRTSVTEFIKMPSGAGEPNETRTINYTYDNLNRVITEDANDSSGMYGYLGSYTYDIVGNRLRHTVDCNSKTLVTDYTYDPNVNQLTKEVHDGPEYAFIWNDQRVYAYAGNGDGRITHYRIGNTDKDVGHIKAFFIGLPSKWSPWLFYAALILVPLAFLSPAAAGIYARMRKRPGGCKIRLSLYHRCVLVFLAYALLIGPFGFESLSEGATLYSQLATTDWASGDRTIEYEYDNNGSQTKKTTKETSTSTVLETTAYEYNLQNRMSRMIVSYEQDSNDVNEVTEYTYNDSGIRVKSYYYKTIDSGPKQNEKTKLFLIDAYNHTGYAQTLEQWSLSGSNPDITYTIGDDIITQKKSTGVRHFLYDGHGSTRQLIDNNENIINEYSYDAYGVMLGGNPSQGSSPATNLLYTGEHFDTNMQMYNLRSRWYNQNTGRFNRMDTFAGNNSAPQSLHKYLYAHCDPINNLDPSGKFIGGMTDLVSTMNARAWIFWGSYGGAILSTLTYTAYICAGVFAVSSIALAFIEWGYLPHNMQDYMKAIQFYSGVGLVLSLTALSLLSTLPDPRQTARQPIRRPRLALDEDVDGNPAPQPLSNSRPVAQNQHINAEKDRDVQRLLNQGATQVKVDQRQTALEGNSYVQKGLNRPDNQGLFENDPPIHFEYDTRLRPLIQHRDRILSNDPSSKVILKLFDSVGNYTIVP